MEGPRGFQHPHHNLPDNAHGVSTRTARARRHLVNHTFPDNSGNSAIMFELQKRKEKRNHRLYRL